MEQGWYSLLFAHWPVPISEVRALVPSELEIDAFQGEAWISITPFQMRMRPRGLFALGNLWSFPELNCRTYVRYRDFAGIYFFSLDAGSRLAVAGARTFYRLPYFWSEMHIRRSRSEIYYTSARRLSSASFSAVFRPTSSPRYAAPGTLEHWLIERYRLYTVTGGRVYRADIHHAPWPLQDATADIIQNTIGAAAGLSVDSSPVLTGYSEKQEVLVWPLRTASPGSETR
jgi:uncharacterized protein YqjF (DUF2071 family)